MAVSSRFSLSKVTSQSGRRHLALQKNYLSAIVTAEQGVPEARTAADA
jgi:hypothetical protein